MIWGLRFASSLFFFLSKALPKIKKFKKIDLYKFKVKKKSVLMRCEICLKSTIKTPKRRYLHRSELFIVNFEHVLHLVLQ